jgi:hypothetical protein
MAVTVIIFCQVYISLVLGSSGIYFVFYFYMIVCNSLTTIQVIETVNKFKQFTETDLYFLFDS